MMPELSLKECVDHTWPRTDCFFETDEKRTTLDRPYCRVHRGRLQKTLRTRSDAAGVRRTAGGGPTHAGGRWDPPRHVLLEVYAVKLGQVAVNIAILKHGHLFELLELFLQRRRLGREVPSTKRGAACAVSGAVFGARLWMV